MPNFKNCNTIRKSLYLLLMVLYLSGCASIQQPSGGPKDTQPPKVVKEIPSNLTKNFLAEKIEIQFNEFVKLNNEFTEVSISPALDEMPIFKARKQVLEINFDKQLDSNTTYTINFGKAIVDVNESNVLTNYTYVFSTGNKIDSLSISGNVKNSNTGELLKDATVFILPVKQDSLFAKKRANIFTTTDSAGNFKLNNLREDNYFLYALKEDSQDRIYNSPTEDVAFYTDTINLSENIENINLRVFRQVPDQLSVKSKKIEQNGRITIELNKRAANAALRVLDPASSDSKKYVELTPSQDSLLLWIPELSFDSLAVAVAAGNQFLDTVKLTRNKRDTYSRSITFSNNLSADKLKPGTDLQLILSAPGSSLELAKVTLLEDSILVSGFQIAQDTVNARKYFFKYPWKANRQYILQVAEQAFTDLFGNKSNPYTTTFSLDSEENYGSIALAVTVPDTTKNYLVEWMNQENMVLRTDSVKNNTVLNYTRYPTAKYKIRVVYDENKNGRWDTGNVKERRQPEKTWMFGSELTLRPNWDLEEQLVIPPI